MTEQSSEEPGESARVLAAEYKCVAGEGAGLSGTPYILTSPNVL